MKRNKILVTLLLFCVGVAAFCLYGLMASLHSYNLASQVYSIPIIHPAQSSSFTYPCQSKLAAGSTQFTEQVAWLQASDKALDYPIVQGADNDFYLNHLADGTQNPLGAIFLDTAASSDFSAPVSTVYGHWVSNKQMLGSLTQYCKQEYYNLHPVMWLCTEQTHYTVDLFAAYIVSDYTAYPQSFQDEEAFSVFINQAKESSFFESTITPQFEDRLVILSTCYYNFNNIRFAVIGRLRPTEHYDKMQEDRK